MSPWLERCYHSAPVALQNVGVSLYGLKLYRERYGKGARGYFEELLKSQYFSTDEMRRLQQERFVALARHAIDTVPYYRDWARSIGLESRDIESLDDLSLFPILKKQAVRENPERLISNQITRRHLIELDTSGTSGTPLRIFTDKGARTHHYAFFSRLRSWFGVAPTGKRATFFGRIIMPANATSPPFWRHDYVQNNLIMSSYHLSHANLPYYYAKLRAFAPDEIIGYPSSLHALARFILQTDREPIPVKLTITTAETLLPYQRIAIDAAFSGTVVNQYGCTEMAFFASECEHGPMHFHPEHGIIEIIDGHDHAISTGSGRLLATGLINATMPLIRYDVGDNVSTSSQREPCNCGRSFPRIDAIDGRADDILYQLDGTPVGRLDPVFKGGNGISEAQIIQHRDRGITVRLVPAADYNSAHRDWLETELRKRLGQQLSIKIEPVNSIPKESNGKFKAVIQERPE